MEDYKMGTKRVGLARTQALIENLKRELAMGGSRLTAVKGVEMGAGFDVVTQKGSEARDEITPKGFARPTPVFKVLDFISEKHKNSRQNFSHKGSRVEVNILDTSDIKAAIEELKMVEEKFNKILQKGKTQNKKIPK